MKKVIANAVYKTDQGYTPVNLKVTKEGVEEIYIKNSFTSLLSAKINNPDVDVILFTNFDLDLKYKNLFLNNDIKHIKLAECIFDFSTDFKWAPAFYKLDVTNYLIDKYDLVCVIDTDTIIVDSCKYLWEEMYNKILLFDVDYSLESPKRQITIDFAKKYYDLNLINHWGGEIIAGSSNELRILINECIDVYNLIQKEINQINPGFGQEALMSVAIAKSNCLIERCNKYCMRFWTRRIYLIDTNFNNIPIWHLPAEKDEGLLKIYNLFIKTGTMPSKKKIAKYVCLSGKMGIIESIKFYYKKCLKYRNRNITQKINNISNQSGWIDK